uniref:Cycloidea-like protein n=1 Tax=Scorzonera sinensis TaxID=2293338 RepID=A0A346D3H9_9ASTR|nr:cycloidea-like protein [Scorzonera sinensis]
MFSSNPFAQLDSSTHDFPPTNFFFDDKKDDLYFNHQHLNHPFVSEDYCLGPYNPSPATENFTTSKQDSFGVEGLELEQHDEHKHVLGSEVSPRKKKKTPKKDHHSKIHTAQGPRDRRVRLSIDVARKFFYLQDLLGFDKPSKTLDWLFKKSKIPIDELVERMKQSSSSTVTDESQVGFLETVKGDEQDKKQKKKYTPSCVEDKGRKMIRKQKSESPVNQSRAEARARARERTKEKLHTKKLDDESNKFDGDCCCHGSLSYFKLQSSFWSTAVEVQNDYTNLIGESLMDEKMLMASSMWYGYQHNPDVSKRS